MNSKLCVHIIIRDKFTDGYIEFLEDNKMGWEHMFFTFTGDYELKSTDAIVVNDYSQIVKNYSEMLEQCDRIVVAAFFDGALALLKLPKRIWRKIYIQFWGGDIYRFRDIRKGLVPRSKQLIAWFLVRTAIKRSAGVLTLVENDYRYIEEIYHVKGISHRVVQVPDDFYKLNHIDYKSIISKEPYVGPKRVLVGNSATIENRHLEIFEILKDKIKEGYEVLVPLSYGDDVYRHEIITKGQEMFGTSFVPVIEFMSRDRYVTLLSSCETAIFNNDRQQATGNIIMLVNMGKKLYLRSDTSMWDFFEKLRFNFHKVEDLPKENIEAIFSLETEEKKNNYQALQNMEEEAFEQWREFLN